MVSVSITRRLDLQEKDAIALVALAAIRGFGTIVTLEFIKVFEAG